MCSLPTKWSSYNKIACLRKFKCLHVIKRILPFELIIPHVIGMFTKSNEKGVFVMPSPII